MSRYSVTLYQLQRTTELEIRQRKWGWLSYTFRRPPGDIAKAVLEWNPQGGRPRTTWRRTILEEIRHQGKTWKEVKVLAKNRVRWRKFVRALCSFEEWWETIYIYINYTSSTSSMNYVHITCSRMEGNLNKLQLNDWRSIFRFPTEASDLSLFRNVQTGS